MHILAAVINIRLFCLVNNEFALTLPTDHVKLIQFSLYEQNF